MKNPKRLTFGNSIFGKPLWAAAVPNERRKKKKKKKQNPKFKIFISSFPAEKQNTQRKDEIISR